MINKDNLKRAKEHVAEIEAKKQELRDRWDVECNLFKYAPEMLEVLKSINTTIYNILVNEELVFDTPTGSALLTIQEAIEIIIKKVEG